MTNAAWPSISDYNDIHSRGQYRIAMEHGLSPEEAMECVRRFSRDNARTPMQWDGSENAGFTSGTPWLPLNEDHTAVNALAEDGDPGSVLRWYKTLISLRGEHTALTEGSFREVLSGSESIYAYIREDRSEKLLIAVNLGREEETYDPAEAEMAGAGEILLGSYTGTPGAREAELGRLRPYEAVIVKIR